MTPARTPGVSPSKEAGWAPPAPPEELQHWTIGLDVEVLASNLQEAMDLGAVIAEEVEGLSKYWTAEPLTYRNKGNYHSKPNITEEVDGVIMKEVMPKTTSDQ